MAYEDTSKFVTCRNKYDSARDAGFLYMKTSINVGMFSFYMYTFLSMFLFHFLRVFARVVTCIFVYHPYSSFPMNSLNDPLC